jgi:hypothetical protein
MIIMIQCRERKGILGDGLISPASRTFNFFASSYALRHPTLSKFSTYWHLNIPVNLADFSENNRIYVSSAWGDLKTDSG